MFSLQSEQSGVPPQSITFSRGKTRLLYIDLQCYARTSGGVPPQSITFSHGKTRLLYIDLQCYARTSGAAAHGHRFSTSADTPLTVRFTAITSKLTSSFFYKAFSHLIYGLLRVNKVTVCNQSGAQRATTRIDRGGTPPRIGTGSLPAVHGNQFSKIINSEMVILTPITINNHFNNANYVTKVDHLCS